MKKFSIADLVIICLFSIGASFAIVNGFSPRKADASNSMSITESAQSIAIAVNRLVELEQTKNRQIQNCR